MLGMKKSSLLFPTLRRVGEDTLKHPTNTFMNEEHGRTFQLYKLDWRTLDEAKMARHSKWASAVGRPLPEDNRLVELPQPFEDQVNNYVFALSGAYLQGVRQHSNDALECWSRSHPFDTMIREICREPAVTHVWVAFMLLSDCIWDQESHYWDRERLLPLSASMMAYKFWSGQTGGGLFGVHSRLIDLEQKFRPENEDNHVRSPSMFARRGSVEKVQAFVRAIRQHEESLRKPVESEEHPLK